jgi:4-amino-4-deoxy-L-arabinose transferase-like glycosyltransferase
LATIAWARRFGDGIALVAALMLACLPPLLGHAGVATTDMAVAAMLPVALLALDRWNTSRSWRDALLLGAAMGLGALSKYSFLLFFPVCAAVLLIARRRRVAAGQLLAALALAIAVICAGYRFSFAPLSTFRSVTMPPPSTLSPAVAWLYTHVPIPAPQFIGGLVILHYYNAAGRLAYLLGEVRQNGWWYYFPVVFFFKTPLPFQLLAIAGTIVTLVRRRAVELALMPLALMLSVLGSSINIGVRHILPIYPLLAVVAAIGCAALWSRSRVAAAVLVGWLLVGSVLAHPNYLAWFNEAAGAHPERIAVDSNLDWGQDMLRLAQVLNRQHIDHIALKCVSAFPLERRGIQNTPLAPFTQTHGWVAVSETALALDPDARAGGYSWLETLPYSRVGSSIRLLYVK